MIIKECKLGDEKKLLELIKELASYEKMLDQVTGTEKEIIDTIFSKKIANALFLENDDKDIIGYVLYFYNYSTFLCKGGIYIEDIYVQEKHRGLGYGSKVFDYFKEKCKSESLGRIEWSCLGWNKPSLEFYKGLGATVEDEWVKLRLTEF